MISANLEEVSFVRLWEVPGAEKRPRKRQQRNTKMNVKKMIAVTAASLCAAVTFAEGIESQNVVG